MNAAELKSLIYHKMDQLFPDYNSAVFSISSLENPIEAYVDKALYSCIPQLIKDADISKLDTISGEWTVIPDDEVCWIKRVWGGDNLPYVLSFDSSDNGLKIQTVRTSDGFFDIKISARVKTYLRNIMLSNKLCFRKVYNGYESRMKAYYETYFSQPTEYYVSNTYKYTDLLVPRDYNKFSHIENSGERPIHELSVYPSEFYKMQFSAAKNGKNRPVAFKTTERNIRIFPNLEVREFRYIPNYIPEEVPEILIDAYTWLCAGEVLSQMDDKSATAALNFYKAAL